MKRALANLWRAHRDVGSFTNEEWEALCAFYDYRCVCCGNQYLLTVDHVIPFGQGGMNTIDNVQPLCEHCNSRKNNKTTDYRQQPFTGPQPITSIVAETIYYRANSGESIKVLACEYQVASSTIASIRDLSRATDRRSSWGRRILLERKARRQL